MRTLTRKGKDRAIVLQFARCAYCEQPLEDHAQVDHMDECRDNNAPENLAACCGTCHAAKTMHYRKGRPQLHDMLQQAREFKAACTARWAEATVDEAWDAVPDWLRSRVPRDRVALLVHAHKPWTPMDIEQFRFRPT